jgi:hypothetical protein
VRRLDETVSTLRPQERLRADANAGSPEFLCRLWENALPEDGNRGQTAETKSRASVLTGD